MNGRLCTGRPHGDVAVSVATGSVGAHVGVCYVPPNGAELRHLHLAFHHDLRDDAWEESGLHVVSALSWIEARQLRRMAELVARRKAEGAPPMPYAFDRGRARLDERGGLVLAGSRGLTCASFVMVLFAAASVPLLEDSSWEVRTAERSRADEAAQRALLGYLRGRDPTHAAAVERELGCTRFRAEEVAAASGLQRPVGFLVAERAGRELLAELGGPGSKGD